MDENQVEKFEFNTNKVNPLKNPHIIDRIKSIANKRELAGLRQLSQHHYNSFSKTYFDKHNKQITINPRASKESTWEWDFCSKVSTECPYIYRNVYIKDFKFMERLHLEHGKRVLDLLRWFGPHLNTIKIDWINNQSSCRPNSLPGLVVSFLQQLRENLINLENFVIVTDCNLETNRLSSVILPLLSETTKIEIFIPECERDFVNLIKTMNISNYFPNVSVHYSSVGTPGNSLGFGELENDINIMKKKFCNKKVIIPKITVCSPSGLLSSRWSNQRKVHYYKLFDDLFFFLTTCQTMEFINYDCTWSEMFYDISEIPNLGNWKQNILTLEFKNYKYPLVCLGEFPNLTEIKLESIDINVCLFPYQAQTDEENLKQIFDGSKKLNVVIKSENSPGIERILPVGSQLAIYIESMVQSLTFV